MKETQLLVFQCGGEEYGVFAEDVCGIIGGSMVNQHGAGLVVNLRNDLKKGDSKRLIMHHKGIQIIIEADEIIRAATLDHSQLTLPDATTASFRIWKFKKGVRTPGEGDIN